MGDVARELPKLTDVRMLRGIANPVRNRILEELSAGGPARAADVFPPDVAARVEALPEPERLQALDLVCQPASFVVGARASAQPGT